jgi:signal transduction histidine kinase
VSTHRNVNTRQALLRFIVASMVVELVLGFGGVMASRAAAREESISDARRVTSVLARAVVMPNLTDELLEGDPKAIRRLDEVIIGRVTARSLVRVKLWAPTGDGRLRVVYSDEHRLIGSVHAVAADEERALREGRVDADLSDASRPENQFERGQGKLLEVYLPIRTPGGAKLLFETYARYSAVAARAGMIWRQFIPITLGVLLALQLVQLPLAWSMAHRLDGSLRERERLVQRVAEASDMERRRIARDLHDGVVQDLAATSFALVGAAEHASRSADVPQAAVLHEAGDAIRASIRSLRTMLVDIYPPSLQRAGLPTALQDLIAPLKGRDIAARLAIPDEIAVDRQTAEVVFRVAQEALRNVIAHSKASVVELAVTLADDRLVLTVTDDGIGFGPNTLAVAPAGGHVVSACFMTWSLRRERST